jgi:hypothetical protein
MRLRDNPLIYLTILYLIFKFVWILIFIQFGMFILYYPKVELSLTFYLSCVITHLCEMYIVHMLKSANFKVEDYINEL